MAELLLRLGSWSARRARTVVAAWLVALALVGGAYALLGGTLASSVSIPGTPTAEVTDRLATELPAAAGGTAGVVLTTASGEEFTIEQRDGIARLAEGVAEVDGIETVVDPFATEAQRAEQAAQLDSGRAQIEQGRAELAQGRAELEQGRTELAQGQAQLDAARAQLAAAGAPAQGGFAGEAQQAALEAQLAALDAEQAALDAGAAVIEAGAAELEAGEAELEAQNEQLRLGEALLDMAAEIRTVSQDGSAAVLTVVFTASQFEIEQETRDAVVEVFESGPVDGVEVDYSAELTSGVPELLGVGEVVGVVVAGVVLVVMLGTLVGAGLPILAALVGVGIGALGALSLSGVVEMSSVTPMLGVMLGLAVGIDYSLFIVNRHRRQLKAGYDVEESIGLANGTSGNAVVFAGMTVLIALLALNITGIPFLGLMGTVGAMCVAIAVLLAVTFTPALLSLLGLRVLSRRERARLGTAASTTAGATGSSTTGAPAPAAPAPARAMSTPGALLRAVLAVAALVVVAIPALELRLGLPDGSSEPHDSTQYRAYATVAEKFGAGQAGTLVVVADLPGSPTEEEVLAHQVQVGEQLFAQDDVVAVAPVGTSEDRTVAAFQVVPAEGPTTESTEELVHTLRTLSPLEGDIPIAVAGQASGNIDISDKLAGALPTYLAVVVGLSMLILVLVFRSVFVPVVATLGFILSFFAALGGVVAIYQWGWLGAVFGVETPGPVLNFLPTILVGILFGLAMDYMLFLGSGMREAYAHGAPARVAVVEGVRAGRAVVTAAAIIMVSVFGGFVFSHSAMIRPIGFSLAFGVLVDAFVVRMTLVPALMHLAGDKAWWLPHWLDRLLPDVDVEGSALERRHPHVAHAPASAGAPEPAPASAAAPADPR
ncbi:MMPL family transporter [Cellulomonas cellasea]|uniref:RND superfamily putative drug exporter n=1 Tax=Cellulomonas cellasea TaxID=43670 RepID=A0A7W4UH54_9CELL|nr:MMPL family transporter [Cellulomonas cellasea]MBB2924075.1 RND superfamily putative drug exporter [Cellulomonas cellasea]